MLKFNCILILKVFILTWAFTRLDNAEKYFVDLSVACSGSYNVSRYCPNEAKLEKSVQLIRCSKYLKNTILILLHQIDVFPPNNTSRITNIKSQFNYIVFTNTTYYYDCYTTNTSKNITATGLVRTISSQSRNQLLLLPDARNRHHTVHRYRVFNDEVRLNLDNAI